MHNNTPTNASLHRLSEFVKQTRIILSVSTALLNIYNGSTASTKKSPLHPITRVNIKELKKFVSDWVIENGHDAGNALKNIGDRLAAIEMIIGKQKSDKAYFTSICELLVAFDEANMSDILLDSKYEKHFISVMLRHLRSHSAELSELEQEIKDTFAPADVTVPMDLFLELESVIDRFKHQEKTNNVDIELFRPRYMPPLLDLDRQAFRMAVLLLLENALKYTGDMREGETPWITVEIFESHNEIRINIQNWGPPIFRHEERKIKKSGFRGNAARALNIHGHGHGMAQISELEKKLAIRIIVKTKEDVDHQTWSPGDNFITNATIKIPKSYSRTK